MDWTTRKLLRTSSEYVAWQVQYSCINSLLQSLVVKIVSKEKRSHLVALVKGQFDSAFKPCSLNE
jgi:hypothetical protein